MPRLSLIISLALVVGCNEAPTPSSATISPVAPTTLEDLRLIMGEATDPNRSDSPTQRIRWALNGQEIATLNDRKIIPSSMTEAGDVWTAKIIASDGELDSIPRTVSTTIQNTQAHGTVRFEDETPEPGEALVAVASFADLDDNEIELTWHWALNGQATSHDEQTIPAGVTQKGEAWTVSVVGFDGIDSSEAAQSTVIIGNSAPILRSVSIGPDDAVAGVDLIATVAAIDPDGDPVTFRYNWVVDGQAIEETGGQLDGLHLTRDQRVDVWVTATDGTASSQPMRASLFVNNSRPTVAAVTFNRDHARAQDALICVAEGVADADYDELELSYSWSINNTVAWWQAELGVATSRGDVVSCTISASDDSAASVPVSSPQLTIDNSPPTDNGIQFTTDTPTAGSDLGVAFVAPSDPDGDEVFPRYAWTVNDKAAQDGPWLSAGQFSRGDVVGVTAILTDGTDRGELRTAQLIVRNAPPVVQDVALSGSPTTGDLTATVTATDADDDTLVTTYEWHINGAPSGVTSNTLGGQVTQRGDEVETIVQVQDGMGGVTTAQSGVILVGNRAPTLVAVTIDATSASVGDVLTALFAPATDPDGDDIIYSYAWQIDGTVVGTDRTLDIPQGFGGETVSVTVTPSDNLDAGDSITSQSIPFVNQAPTLTDVMLTPQTGATVNSVLTATWTATDPENDELEVTYTWLVAGTTQPVSSANFPVREFASAGDDVWVSVVVSDGTNPSELVSSSRVTIGNSTPEPLELSFEPSIVQPDTALKCAVNGLSDADGDDLTIDIQWFADGEVYAGETTDDSYDGDTIPAGTVGLYETWECQGTASDGTDSSTTQVIDDDVSFGDENITGQYTAQSHVLYRVRAVEFPEENSQNSYTQACTDIGALPVSCDANELGASYDASAFGALAFDTATYSCDISGAVSALTGWQGLVSFHQPDLDPRGVCEEGCVEDSWAAHPLCAVAIDTQ